MNRFNEIMLEVKQIKRQMHEANGQDFLDLAIKGIELLVEAKRIYEEMEGVKNATL